MRRVPVYCYNKARAKFLIPLVEILSIHTSVTENRLLVKLKFVAQT